MQTLRNTAVKCAKKTFANKGHFEGHINSHNAIKPFKCTQCSSKFSFKSALLRHVKTCDKKTRKNPNHLGVICVVQYFQDTTYWWTMLKENTKVKNYTDVQSVVPVFPGDRACQNT